MLNQNNLAAALSCKYACNLHFCDVHDKTTGYCCPDVNMYLTKYLRKMVGRNKEDLTTVLNKVQMLACDLNSV